MFSKYGTIKEVLNDADQNIENNVDDFDWKKWFEAVCRKFNQKLPTMLIKELSKKNPILVKMCDIYLLHSFDKKCMNRHAKYIKQIKNYDEWVKQRDEWIKRVEAGNLRAQKEKETKNALTNKYNTILKDLEDDLELITLKEDWEQKLQDLKVRRSSANLT